MVPQMKRLRKEGIGRIGIWVKGISYNNPYPEFETELKPTPQSVISQRVVFGEVRDSPNLTHRSFTTPTQKTEPRNGLTDCEEYYGRFREGL